MTKNQLKTHFNALAKERDRWRKKNWYYHQNIEQFLQCIVPKESSILDIGCSTGDLLASLNPKRGKGIDISQAMINEAKRKYPSLAFECMDAQDLLLRETYDYIIIANAIGFFSDIQRAFQEIHRVIHSRSRLVIVYYNYLWQPFLKLGEWLGIKMPEPWQNWISPHDLENFLYLAGFEVIKRGRRLLFPFYIPLLSSLLNRYLVKLPFIQRFALAYYVIARQIPQDLSSPATVSIIVPARNEAGNIEPLVKRIPPFGSHTEIIFVEGHSKDNTLIKIREVQKKYSSLDIKVFVQSGEGKGDAVRKGFDKARGEVLMILDADLTVQPEELPKFYQALIKEKGDFINGSRLVYPLEKESMRFLNLLGNKFFGVMFSWLLDQRIKDTLCGTKVLWKKDYEQIKEGRKFFGEFDPFGDFDLLFGAAKLNLKIVDLPIRYHERTYGTTNIKRFSHGWLLLRICLFAMKKIKFI